MFVAVIAALDWVTVAFHAWATVCPPPNDQRSVHPLIGSPRLVTATEAPKPPCHCELTVYDTWQPAAAACAAVVTTRVVPSAAASNAATTRRMRLFAMSTPSVSNEILFGTIAHIHDRQ